MRDESPAANDLRDDDRLGKGRWQKIDISRIFASRSFIWGRLPIWFYFSEDM